MAKSTNGKTDSVVATGSGLSSLRSLAHKPPASVTEHDIACRAYDLYLARDGGHGHDVDDWLQAERELREAVRSAAA